MSTLSKELRRTLENAVADARRIAEAGAEQALKQLAVHHSESWSAMTTDEKALREKLRAHGKQLGDKREVNRTQEIPRLKQACAYEHWHRMLFARFLAENNLLIHPDYGEPLSMEEVRELAREQNADWLSIAASFAQKMLLEVFRADDPVLDLILPPETRQKLEEKLAALPTQVFTAEDSLGWVYQFWQRDEKDAVNKSEVKIGASEIPPLTQLFTDDYMVLSLLHNTLGAWWTAKRGSSELPGYTWTYLRLDDEGCPIAGRFEGWPKHARELRVLDPSMGSGHFLAFAIPILARMRMEEESLSLPQAVRAVLGENLHGLELDPRCSQIAAFNLALTAWRLVGEHFEVPELNVACSGLAINAPKSDWIRLAGPDSLVRVTMEKLYDLFHKAPTLGSLIDPSQVGDLISATFDEVQPIFEQALAGEVSNVDQKELTIAAHGLLAAARILAAKYTLVVTNVPYLGRGRQHPDLADYCERYHDDAKLDLATCFVDRSLQLCASGGSVALVTTQNWLFVPTYSNFRKRLLTSVHWQLLCRLGTGAFEMITGEVVNVALLTLTKRSPAISTKFCAIDVSNVETPAAKAAGLISGQVIHVEQLSQLKNPDYRVILVSQTSTPLLASVADAFKGLSTGDLPRFIHRFWELPRIVGGWTPYQGGAPEVTEFGGRNQVLFWEDGSGEMVGSPGCYVKGTKAWGKLGISVNQTTCVPTMYTGELFEENAAVIVPHKPDELLAIWMFLKSPEYSQQLSHIDQSLKVTNKTLVKVPFELKRWKEAAVADYPNGMPAPYSSDPRQWLFSGHPRKAAFPLQAAVARLLGYRWPRQTGSEFYLAPPITEDDIEDFADEDGIVCLNSIAGEPPAADRLRALLAHAFGSDWSAAKLAELLGGADSLESWLRDFFFEKHCEIFQNRPFVWHIWDGRKDGFHALVNYHKLAAPNGQGRKTLEKLIYTALGDWIGRQRAEVAASVDGADARLTAAQHLQSELEKILVGEDPYDVFVRWKPLHRQPVGWEPDLNDGVRLNIRPWVTATLALHTKPKKGACILRVTPKVVYGKDRGKEPSRDKGDFPWFADSTDRDNDIHLGLDEKRKARERRKK